MDFKWNSWNIEHLAEHGISPEEAEFVVFQAKRPFPTYMGGGKYLIRGQGPGGEYLQVIFIYDRGDGRIFLIHARPLTRNEKRALIRRRKP